MKAKIVLYFLFVSLPLFAQSKKILKQAAEIEAEGRMLYRSEMASWYGSDLFMETFKNNTSRIGGYISYPQEEETKCVFYSNDPEPKALGTISFDSTFSVKTALQVYIERQLSDVEKEYVTLRVKAKAEIQKDTLFSHYKNSSLNLIPVINGNMRRVYVITGPKNGGVILFGNDYILDYDKDYNLLSKKKIHKSLIPFEFKKDDTIVTSGIHTHLDSTGLLMTATDICTLLLYQRFTSLESYMVMSSEYVSIWNCKTSKLTVMKKEAFMKIVNDKPNEKN